MQSKTKNVTKTVEGKKTARIKAKIAKIAASLKKTKNPLIKKALQAKLKAA